MRTIVTAIGGEAGKVCSSPVGTAASLLVSGARLAAGHAVDRVFGNPALDLLLAIWSAIP